MKSIRFPGVYKQGKNYFVKTQKRKSYFGESIYKKDGLFRYVDPKRSKLFAAIAKGVSQLGLKEDSKVLYLGASHGYTVSFLSDMLTKGEIYALDFAPRVMRDLVFLAEDKKNIAPMFFDASKVEDYKKYVDKVDVVFMDIAQRDQVGIFLKNCDEFLTKGGFAILALKARSMAVNKKPKELFKQVRKDLEKVAIVVDYRELDPYEKDHAVFVIKKK